MRLRARPELKVRTRSGYFAPDERKAAAAPDPDSDPEARREREIAQALGSLFPLQDVPLRLAADFIALPPQGSQAVLKIHVDLKNVPFERKDDRYRADLEIAGAVYDESGKLVGDVAGERAALNLTAESYVRTVAEGLTLQKSVPLPPGLYQVRLAAREASRVAARQRQPLGRDPRRRRAAAHAQQRVPAGRHAGRGQARPAQRAPRAEGEARRGEPWPTCRSTRASGPARACTTPSTSTRRRTAASGQVTLQAQVWQGKQLVGVTPKHELQDAPEGRRWSERIALEAFPPGDYELRVVATGARPGRRPSGA